MKNKLWWFVLVCVLGCSGGTESTVSVAADASYGGAMGRFVPGPCLGTTEGNAIPDGACDPSETPEWEAWNQSLEDEKMEYLVNHPIGMGSPDTKIDIKLKNFPIAVQQCRNWCGPALVQMILAHAGVSQTQEEIAHVLIPPDKNGDNCGEPYGGACLITMQSYLNQQLGNVFSAGRIGYETQGAAETLIERVMLSVGKLNRPVIALINQAPPHEEYRFPSWEGSYYDPGRGHYVGLIGYVGAYTGANDSAWFYFREGSGRNFDNGVILRETVGVNALVAELQLNGGRGSCMQVKKGVGYNVLW